MKKHKNIIRFNSIKTFVLACIAFLPIIAIVGNSVALAAGTCYTDAGPLKVGTQTTVCAIDPQGRKSYVDTSGNSVPQPVDGHCYVGTTSGGGSFSTITYKENDCASLELLRTNALKSACTDSGGTATMIPDRSRESVSCACPIGTSTNAVGKCDGSSAGAGPNTTVPTASVAVATDSNADCLDINVQSSNCGIIRYINLAFNFVSGGVTLAIIGNIILAGIQYSTAQGDPSAVGKSKKRMRDAIIAFIMFLSLYAFIQWLIPGGVF
jgi:hypothetical protein